MQNLIRLRAFAFSIVLLTTLSCNKSSTNSCNMALSGTVTASDGTNGSIVATASGGTGFTYSKDGTTFQSSGTFSNLSPGNYTITAKNSDGCSASKDFTVDGTKTYLITKSTWKFSGATVGGSDVSAFLQACQKDNILTFTTGGNGTLDEGATKCNAGDPQTTPFTWNFLASETQLFVSATLFTGGSSTFTLVSLSSTQLVLSQVITVGGTPQTAVVTFIH